ncbi:hypothetical protein AB0K20_03165 [Micromonospora matsumotoense]|uniref:hypothetical protein n=1 Tax=Micromonospora matsumotoense TaxID=121616 RepID=UPI003441C19C
MIRRLIRYIGRHLARHRPPAPLDATGPATCYGTRTGAYAGTITTWRVDRDIW